MQDVHQPMGSSERTAYPERSPAAEPGCRGITANRSSADQRKLARGSGHRRRRCGRRCWILIEACSA